MAERLDGSVLLAGCDKSIPGMLMAAARLDLASRLPLRRLDRAGLGQAQRRHREGHHDHRLVRGRRRRARPGKMSRGRRSSASSARSPRARARAAACTPPTRWPRVAEALGMSLPGSRAPRRGRPPPRLLRAPLGRGRRQPAAPGHHGPRHPHEGGVRERASPSRWRSAARPTSCCTCSRSPTRPRSSSRSHDFNRIGDKVPHIGRHEAVRQVRHERRRPPRRHPGAHEGAARRGPAARRRAHRHRQDARREPRRARTPTRSTARCIRTLDNPIHATGGITVLHGSIAPEGAVVKTAGFDAQRLRGPGPRVRARARRDGRPRRAARSARATSSSSATRAPRAARACARCSRSPPPSRARASEKMYYS